MPWPNETDHFTALDSLAHSHPLQDMGPVLQFLERLRELREGCQLCDTTVHVQGAEFRAHRAVLAAWSPRLATDILGKSQSAGKISIYVDYAHSTAFAECLQYMYSGEITPVLEHIDRILHLGKVLMLESLCRKCEEFLVSQLKLENFVDLYFKALKFELINLQETVAEFVKFNVTSVIENDVLLRLEPQDFKIFITHGKMANISHEFKFSLIIGWVGLKVLERDKYLLHLFDQLSWSSNVGDLLTQITMTQNIFTTSHLCLFQLLYSLVISQGHPLGPFEELYPDLHLMFSHMLTELSHPKAFQNPTNFPMNVVPVAISVSIESVNISSKLKGKDACMNTEISYFSESDVLPVEVDGESLGKIDDAIFNDTEKKNNLAGVSLKKHRRKSLPRKIKVVEKIGVKLKDTKSKRSRRSKKTTTKKGKKVTNNNDLVKDFVDSLQMKDLEGNSDVVAETIENADSLAAGVLEDTEDIPEAFVNSEVPMSDIHVTRPDNGTAPAMKSAAESSKAQSVETEKVLTNEKESIKLSINLSKRSKVRSAALKKSSRNRTLKGDNNKLKQTHTAGKMSSGKSKQTCAYENCYFVCRKPEMLEKHIERVHMTNVELTCYKCDYKTNDMKALCLHAKCHYTQAPYNCEFTDCQERFMQISFLIRHHMTHLNVKPYQCDICFKQFTVYNRLSCHKKLHEGRQYQCDVCNKHFTTKGCMQQHRMIHFNNKPFLCDTCGFSTKHQSHLISHQKIHTGNVLRCTYPECTYTTPKQGHMTQHMNSHLNIRNHICQVCGKSFVVRGKLLRHEKIHLKDKLFKCKQCDYQTSRTDRMKLHIESHGIKFRKKKYNIPRVEEEEILQEGDFHQFYERIQPMSESSGFTNGSVSSATFSILRTPDFTVASDMKHVDVLSFTTCGPGLGDGFSSGKLIAIDSLHAAAAAAGISDVRSTDFEQNFERLQSTPFDQI